MVFLKLLPYLPVASELTVLPLCLLAVPAQIIDALSTDDSTVQEGDTVVLVCNVTGVPKPEVTWFRRPHNSEISERQSKMCEPHNPRPGKSGIPSARPIAARC